ncbi:MAG TPA: hypothetical protein H9950_03345 [Candidatus Bacteroides avicola]|uniref:Uncharacterized protein n=1 Tax=Candidatus Bacteroides avicola TaxID=2838468 RepID=A0A9D2HVL8_9BACE|nr:hypothetical protein [Candidatus Bacteroides avicola]
MEKSCFTIIILLERGRNWNMNDWEVDVTEERQRLPRQRQMLPRAAQAVDSARNSVYFAA